MPTIRPMPTGWRRKARRPALGSLLADAGIEAEVTLSGGVCRVLLADAADEPRARSILDANCGTLPCEIETGGDAP